VLNITFITSNNTKLSHARYLASRYNINILHYKKKFYGVGYTEPRISDRDTLLEESINDAIRRWKRNVSENGTQLFFIEDTSVKIDALSDDKNEVPGVDVKYWMQGMNFSLLDEKLKEKGNNRKVSVTSHIVLFLTKNIREVLKFDNEYIIFKSTLCGNITEEEYTFETQILYPWLDNKTFNKWFVPEGFSLPVSMLDIVDADISDFRKGAFEQMFGFLKKYNTDCAHSNIKTSDGNCFLPFDPLYIISGPTCAGKSTLGKFLLERMGYYHIEASDFMSIKYFETHGTSFFVDKNVFAAKLLEVNPIIVVEGVLKYMRLRKIFNKFVITGFRTVDEILYFLKSFSNHDKRIIYVTADFDVRFDRWVNRRRDSIEYSKEKFREINRLQEKMGMPDIERMKNASCLENNNNGLDILYNDFQKKFIDGDLLLEKEENDFNSIKKLSLEKVILVVLAMEYRKDEYRYYTTTEIAHLIKNVFKSLNKNKNNVSRYFNQSYYPYYEIKKDGNKKKYKLSPTGYSDAKFIVQEIQGIMENYEY
jgi:adenylate kinase family enzyme/inosine/xanthosine triphosphate pyrophosphatase family protein